MKFFRIVFITLALLAFVAICYGATFQVIMLVVCLIAQAFCATPKTVKA